MAWYMACLDSAAGASRAGASACGGVGAGTRRGSGCLVCRAPQLKLGHSLQNCSLFCPNIGSILSYVASSDLCCLF